MNRSQLGIGLQSLNLPLRRGLLEAQRLAVSGIQVEAIGDLAPRTMSQTGRREFRKLLSGHHLELTALGCPLRHGLDNPTGLQERIDHLRGVLSLSFELGARVVTVPPCRLPAEQGSSRGQLLTEALRALGRYGDRVGATLALETGPDSGQALGDFLGKLGTGGLGVNFNPAGLLVGGFDPYESVRRLPGRIVHCQARDARLAGSSLEGKEVPLGHGDIDWMKFLSMLEEVDYQGWITVLRGAGDNRLADVKAGVQFLRRFLIAE